MPHDQGYIQIEHIKLQFARVPTGSEPKNIIENQDFQLSRQAC